jgi:hypothetical protein
MFGGGSRARETRFQAHPKSFDFAVGLFLSRRCLMSKPKILLQLDSDPHCSVFDSVVAVDADVDQLFRHSGVTSDQVQALVHGCMFTRGPKDLYQTAIFVGGSNVVAGEELLAAVKRCFFGPMRVSVMMDANGANTTAAAAVLAAARHLNLSESKVLVLAGTGPVGQRVARLLAGRGAEVVLASRSYERAELACDQIRERLPDSQLISAAADGPVKESNALNDVHAVISAGAAGIELLSAEARQTAPNLRVAIDLNAVPPVGLAGIEVMDRAMEREGQICYGAIGVGGTKMKIHKAALRKLFTQNDLVLDAEEILDLGESLESES